MSEPEVLLAAHYQALRGETLERIKIRDQYVVWLATLFTAAIGIYATDAAKWWGFLVGLPLLAAMSGLLYAHTDLTLNALGKWYRTAYGAALEDYKKVNKIGFEIPFWDHSAEYIAYTKTATFYLRYIATAIIILSIGLVSIALSHQFFKIVAPQGHYFITAGQIALSIIGAAGPLFAGSVRRNRG